jgi:hypothetical protein
MTPALKKVVVVGAAILSITMSARASNNAEQVIFSTPGFPMQLTGNQIAASTGFGFWMYFYGLDKHATPVLGEVSEAGDTGIYTAHVVQTTFAKFKANGFEPPPDAPYRCTLSNVESDPMGPNNSVQVDCTLSSALGGGSGTALVTNAVVNVTGPGH